MDDATGLAEALLGLDGFRVLAVNETPDEVCVHGRDDDRRRRMSSMWRAGAGQGAPPRRHP